MADRKSELAREHTTAVEDAGYGASPLHKSTNQLLADLGLAPASPVVSSDEIKEALASIVSSSAAPEELRPRKARHMLEARFDGVDLVTKSDLISEELDRLQEERRLFAEAPAAAAASSSGTAASTKTHSATAVPAPAAASATTTASNATALPLVFKSASSKNTESLLIELQRPDEKLLDLKGDSGAIGAFTVITGQEAVDAEAAVGGVKPETMAVAASGEEAAKKKKKKKKIQTLKLDLKGDVYYGTMVQSHCTLCVLSASAKDAKIEVVLDNFVRARHAHNVMGRIAGEMTKGDANISEWGFEGDRDVNKDGDEEYDSDGMLSVSSGGSRSGKRKNKKKGAAPAKKRKKKKAVAAKNKPKKPAASKKRSAGVGSGIGGKKRKLAGGTATAVSSNTKKKVTKKKTSVQKTKK